MPLLFFLFCCGLSAGIVGKYKGGSFVIWYLIGFCLPVVGTIAAFMSRWESQEVRRQCESCGKLQPAYVQVCTRCGYDMDFPEQPIVSQAVESQLRAGGATQNGE